jgi:hypothetical protein
LFSRCYFQYQSICVASMYFRGQSQNFHIFFNDTIYKNKERRGKKDYLYSPLYKWSLIFHPGIEQDVFCCFFFISLFYQTIHTISDLVNVSRHIYVLVLVQYCLSLCVLHSCKFSRSYCNLLLILWKTLIRSWYRISDWNGILYYLLFSYSWTLTFNLGCRFLSLSFYILFYYCPFFWGLKSPRTKWKP